MAPKAPPPAAPPPPAAEGTEEPELPDGVYRKELSEEQLNGFYTAAETTHEEMLMFSFHSLLPSFLPFLSHIPLCVKSLPFFL